MRIGAVSGAAARIGILVLAVLAFALAGCGGDDETAGTSPASTEPATSAQTTESGPATETEPGAVTSGGPPGADGQPAIVVEAPAAGARVTSPVTVSGTADVFEATVTVILLDADGNELARDFTTATCGTGCRGDFSLELPFEVPAEQPGTIVVQDEDVEGGGTPPHVAEVPVTLAP